jgi:hypothetical protein
MNSGVQRNQKISVKFFYVSESNFPKFHFRVINILPETFFLMKPPILSGYGMVKG